MLTKPISSPIDGYSTKHQDSSPEAGERTSQDAICLEEIPNQDSSTEAEENVSQSLEVKDTTLFNELIQNMPGNKYAVLNSTLDVKYIYRCSFRSIKPQCYK